MRNSQTPIPYGRHQLDEEDIEAVVDVLRRGPLTQGNLVDEFGFQVAQAVGAKYGIAVSSGTAALHLAAAGLEIGRGDEVITTPLTFCATANAFAYQGAKIKLVDIDRNTLNIDPSKIEAAISRRTKAIVPVDFRGHPANLEEISEIAKAYDLSVIEDGSHSLGSTYGGEKFRCGDCSHVDACTFSFHPVKHITTGEGGVLVTNNLDIIRRAELLRKHGIDRRDDMFSESKRIGPWVYDMEDLGFNYRITDFQSALGISQLKRLPAMVKRRREIVDYYNEHLASIPGISLPFESSEVNSNFHLYVIQVDDSSSIDRYDLFERMEKMNYRPMVHYIPLHFLSYYRDRLGYRCGDFPNAENYYQRCISIPLYPSMTDAQVENVVEDLKTCFSF